VERPEKDGFLHIEFVKPEKLQFVKLRHSLSRRNVVIRNNSIESRLNFMR
jgi:hypothetical protein